METTIAIAAHILGLIGMAGVWLVPARLWSVTILRRIGTPLSADPLSVALAFVVLLSIAISAYVALDSLPRVFRCLWEGWCTATRGGALFNLALFGLTVLLVEATWAICRSLLSRRRSSAI